MMDLQGRLRAKFFRNALVLDHGCWPWMGRLKHGYGDLSAISGGVEKSYRAHRVAYEALRGPIPLGLTIDHLCRRTDCVNPMHMECVTASVNASRAMRFEGNRCRRGHEFTPENTYVRNGGRHLLCKTCDRTKQEVTRNRPVEAVCSFCGRPYTAKFRDVTRASHGGAALACSRACRSRP